MNVKIGARSGLMGAHARRHARIPEIGGGGPRRPEHAEPTPMRELAQAALIAALTALVVYAASPAAPAEPSWGSARPSERWLAGLAVNPTPESTWSAFSESDPAAARPLGDAAHAR